MCMPVSLSVFMPVILERKKETTIKFAIMFILIFDSFLLYIYLIGD